MRTPLPKINLTKLKIEESIMILKELRKLTNSALSTACQKETVDLILKILKNLNKE